MTHAIDLPQERKQAIGQHLRQELSEPIVNTAKAIRDAIALMHNDDEQLRRELISSGLGMALTLLADILFKRFPDVIEEACEEQLLGYLASCLKRGIENSKQDCHCHYCQKERI